MCHFVPTGCPDTSSYAPMYTFLRSHPRTRHSSGCVLMHNCIFTCTVLIVFIVVIGLFCFMSFCMFTYTVPYMMVRSLCCFLYESASRGLFFRSLFGNLTALPVKKRCPGHPTLGKQHSAYQGDGPERGALADPQLGRAVVDFVVYTSCFIYVVCLFCVVV